MDVPYTFNGRDSYDPDGLVGDSTDLTFIWTFSDGTISNEFCYPQLCTPGEHTFLL